MYHYIAYALHFVTWLSSLKHARYTIVHRDAMLYQLHLLRASGYSLVSSAFVKLSLRLDNDVEKVSNDQVRSNKAAA